MTHYAERDIEDLDKAGGYYIRHVNALTAEGLHAKWAIAAELGHRDKTIDDLQVVIAQLTSIICNGALTPPTGDGSIVEYCEQSMNQLLAANIAYRGLLEKIRHVSPSIQDCLDATPEALLARLTNQIRLEHFQLLDALFTEVKDAGACLKETLKADYSRVYAALCRLQRNRPTESLERLMHRLEELEAQNVQLKVNSLLYTQMAARVSHLTKLAHTAQTDYIERHSDGETDCVTPYDTYDQPGAECVRQLQAEAVVKAADHLMGYLGVTEETPSVSRIALNEYADAVLAGKVGK